ncbi:choice-of-anchor A family protein [Almyronema epifaneia]|uniref:Choice-of-anchor A family protein n=1 Tax=Almyronema epifaneia S1 TaxID=2991925 RepID=A0ABW6IMA3_9CYAN
MLQNSIRKSPWVALPLAVAIAASFSGHAQAASFGIANDYNVFVFGDMNQSSDSEGRVAVGGNATFSNFGIGDRLDNSQGSDTRLVVGGNLTYNGGQVFGGGAIVGGQINTGVNFNCTPNCNVTTGNLIDFDAAKTYLTGFSEHVGGLAVTGSTEYKWGGIWLQGSNSDVNVFTINGSEFNGKSYLNLNGVGNDSTVVLNILGDTVNIANFGMNLGNLDPSKVLFNFIEATQIQTTGFSFAGSVLATKANVTFNNGNVEGRFIANSVSGSGEFHNFNFEGYVPEYVPPAPEVPDAGETSTELPPEVPGNNETPPEVSGGGSDPVAVPEPTAVAGLAVMGALFGVRRRQSR